MPRLRVVEVDRSTPVAKSSAKHSPARAASPVLSAQEAWVAKQRQFAEARIAPSPAAPAPAPLTAPVVPVEESSQTKLVAASSGTSPDSSSLAEVEPEVWFGPWLPRPGRFPLASVDVTKLPPLGVPVLLPAIDAPDELLADALATALGELEPSPRLLIERVIGHVGPDSARALYEKTRRKENEGGAGVYDRRRTSGGIFFSLVERQMGWRPFLQASVLAALTVGIVPGPSKRKKR